MPGANNYGKSRVRLLRVSKQEGRHDIKELTVAISFEGDFETAHTKGDNTKILPTDTMKNTVYFALARQHPVETVEEVRHSAGRSFPYLQSTSLAGTDRAKGEFVVPPGAGRQAPRECLFSCGRREAHRCLEWDSPDHGIRAGLQDLVVMKTTNSAFDHFLRDPFTTLEDRRNRLLATSIGASWLYPGEEVEFGALWHGVRQTLLEAFAEHKSESLQHTLYAMGEAVLNDFENLLEIHLSLPNKHFNLLNLQPLGMDNPGELFLYPQRNHMA